MSIQKTDMGTVVTIKARSTISPVEADQVRDLDGLIESEKRRLAQEVMLAGADQVLTAHSDAPVRDAMGGRTMPIVVTAKITVLIGKEN